MLKDFYIGNRNILYDQLPSDCVLVLFAGDAKRRTADANEDFFASRSFVYLTGADRVNFIFLAHKQGAHVQETLYIEKPDAQREVWTGRRMTVEEAREASGIDTVLFVEQFEQKLHTLLSGMPKPTLCLSLDRLTCAQPVDKEHAFANDLRARYPHLEIVNVYPLISAQRMRKQSCEIDNMKRAMQLTHDGYKAMMKSCAPGMFEYQLEAEFRYALAKQGARDVAFPPIIASGQNNFYLHYDKPFGQIHDGDLVLVDIGAIHDFCCVDVSRMFPANGVFTDAQKQIYEIALQVNDAAQRWIAPGKTFADLRDFCMEGVREGLRPLGLINNNEDVKKYFWHGVAHHVGFDVHDVGHYDLVMEKDMVFTVDVGIYVREWGVGLRVEDNVLITENGCINLSGDIMRTIDEIEAFMAS